MCVDVGFFFVRHFPPELRRKKEGRLNDVGGGSGQWEQEWKEGPPPLLSARRAPPLRAANGIDSIKRRGNEERERERARRRRRRRRLPCCPDSEARKEKELLGDCLPRLPRSQGESLHGSCKMLTSQEML